MSHFGVSLSIIGAAAILGFLLLRNNRLWMYRLFDHSLVRDHHQLPPLFELPRYFKRNAQGEVDYSAQWPGWDGWYFFMTPDDPSVPTQMIRASLMTGLYGLDGIDNYEKVKLRLSTFQTAEHLSLTPTAEQILDPKADPGRAGTMNHLSQHYVQKQSDLKMKTQALDVAVQGDKIEDDASRQPYGAIEGRWPHYSFEFSNPEAEIQFSLKCVAEDIVWWADLPGLFTYFAAFGKFDGTITYKRGTRNEDTHQLMNKPETYALKGRGCFEHGFARKPFDLDKLWLPIRLFQNIVPSFRPIRYHYELLAGNQDYHGGFMKARGFGIDFRNRGGFVWKGQYKPIQSIKVIYLNNPEPDQVNMHCGVRTPVAFPRSWQVEAVTRDGLLKYTAKREFPPPVVASNMMYYHFDYEGSYQGSTIKGRGYGEYLHI